MVKVSVWRCKSHGEIEMLDWTAPTPAHCPLCGESMERVSEYEESKA